MCNGCGMVNDKSSMLKNLTFMPYLKGGQLESNRKTLHVSCYNGQTVGRQQKNQQM